MRNKYTTLFLAILAYLVSSPACFAAAPQVLQQIHYGDKPSRNQSLDMILPAKVDGTTPIVIYLTGGDWHLPQKQHYLPSETIGALLQMNIGLVLVRHRVKPRHNMQHIMQDIAQASAYVFRQAKKYGYKKDNIYLMGHGSGAHLAALLNTDQRYLAKHKLKPTQFKGVILLSGIYDLTDQAIASDEQLDFIKTAIGHENQQRKTYSPLHQAKKTTPPVLILSAEQDYPGFNYQAQNFMSRLRETGNQHAFHHVISRQDHYSLTHLHNPKNAARRYIKFLLGLTNPDSRFTQLTKARHAWHSPPLSTEDFWQETSLVKTHTINERFMRDLYRLFNTNLHLLRAWPLEKFHSINLIDYVAKQKGHPLKDDDVIVTTNIRNQKLFWRVGDIKAYQPQIVVGIDNEKNLFKLTTFYQTKQEYSWKPQPFQQPLSVRPLGGFLFFLKPPPKEYTPDYFAYYSITAEGFDVMHEDPFKPLRDLPTNLFKTVVYSNGCTSCHRVRGVGTSSHHVRADSLEPHGGYALPLETYSPSVWKEFIFNQNKVADIIGVVPNTLPNETQKAVYDFIEAERNKKQ